MAKYSWRIRGYKGFDTFFDVTIPYGCLTDDQLKQLLKCLSAKEGLSYSEIIGAYSKRKTKSANELLDVQKYGPSQGYSCGQDPHFNAVIVDEKGNLHKPPPLREPE
jgi:hypothetical protein